MKELSYIQFQNSLIRVAIPVFDYAHQKFFESTLIFLEFVLKK